MRITGQRPLLPGELFQIELSEHDAIESSLDSLDARRKGRVAGFWDSEPAPAAVPAALQEAEAHGQAGKTDLALTAYAKVLGDDALAIGLRASAAIAASKLAQARGRLSVAEYFCARAEALTPDSEPVQRRRMLIFKEQRATSEVLALSESLLARHPEELALLRIRMDALLEDARPEEAVAIGEQAQRVAQHKPLEEQSRTSAAFAFALTKNNQADRAVVVLEAALAQDPENAKLHLRISEYVQPNFDDADKRARANAAFEQANRAWRAGRWSEVKKIALQILHIDKRDGLAHRMYATADERAAQETTPLLPQLDTQIKRIALSKKLESVCTRARIDGRPGRVEDLFPDWARLNEAQRATLAYSVLGYAKVLPAIMEKGGQVRFAEPGTSLAAIDPQADIRKKKAFGRMSYVGRGWAYHQAGKVYCGLEKIDMAARGEHNTVTHEVGHLVHFYCHDLHTRLAKEGAAALSPGELGYAKKFDQIKALYQEARERKNGQSLLDAYSGTTVWEYFAQGIMSYLAMDPRGKESSPRLYSRNPHLWQLVAELARATSEYPAESPGPAPPPIGLRELGSPDQLLSLQKEARSLHVRKLAEGLYARLGHLIERDERPWKQRVPELNAMLRRALELYLIDAGRTPRDRFDEPALHVAAMGAAELEAQILLAIEAGVAEKRDVGGLQRLFATLKAGDLDSVRRGLS